MSTIDRYAALKILCENCDCPEAICAHYPCNQYLSIEKLPSVQPERKKGRWYDVGSLSCRCSACGCKSPKEFSFCPNCGADMRGKQDV